MSLLHREDIINYLAEIAMGDLSLTLSTIEQESNLNTKLLLDCCAFINLVYSGRSCNTQHILQNILQSFSELLFIINANGHIQMINKQSRDSS